VKAVRSARASDVLVDLCTQRDYLTSGGARPVLNVEQVRGNLKKLMAVARWMKWPLISCMDARRPLDAVGLPDCPCVIGTAGWQKMPCTLMPKRTCVESDNCLCVSLNILQQVQQVVLFKHHRDPFTNPKLDRLLTELPGRRFIVFGVALEESVRLTVLGLMLRERRVALVYDACGFWNADEGEMTLRQLEAKGCELLGARQLVESALALHGPRRVASLRHRRSVA